MFNVRTIHYSLPVNCTEESFAGSVVCLTVVEPQLACLRLSCGSIEKLRLRPQPHAELLIFNIVQLATILQALARHLLCIPLPLLCTEEPQLTAIFFLHPISNFVSLIFLILMSAIFYLPCTHLKSSFSASQASCPSSSSKLNHQLPGNNTKTSYPLYLWAHIYQSFLHFEIATRSIPTGSNQYVCNCCSMTEKRL